MASKKLDLQEINTVFAEYQIALAKLKTTYPSGKAVHFPAAACPSDPAALCKALNTWFQQYHAWALWVNTHFPGGPGDGVAPPPPPFT